ncbi:T9SS type A sorting domain-containing protein [uncultured Draconibacterium sp.]|uniref:T9SS type A sorting domain-containing protein n=1 Tax=uncultured Draconibacterium sp. TaxID=1573823 RepID=UPI0032164F2D
MHFRFNLLVVLVFVSSLAFGQLSSGGFPLEVNVLKSAENKIVRMPKLQQSVIDKAIEGNELNGNRLKPLKFAHSFEVNLNPANSGQWYSTNAKYNVWKLEIQSENAKSINLIFDKFKLAEGARLFIYNEKENQYLGAFTENNNKVSAKFAVAPVAGEVITVQYEVPEEQGTPVDFEIAKVNHDFIGILKFDRRPFDRQPIAGSCNIDVNCEIGDPWNQVKNSVCRLIVDGDEICSGTLINNTAEDQKPYVLSASHCYDAWDLAETTVYTFSYESPYCAPLDGDPLHSLSGAIMKAHFDSLDFALAELDEIPPYDFRPYYAGWDRSGTLPDSTVSIHHPVGDIKKIAFDYDQAAFATFTSTSIKNPTNGSINIKRWDEGVTEVGSSGGALFNKYQNLIGTLSGGAALCGNPVNDFFARFDMQWDYKSDPTKQLKHWLDPTNSGVTYLNGKNFNTEEQYCNAFTNLNDADEHANIGLVISNSNKGYWGGTNSVGITEFVERFSIPGNEILEGISFGVGKLDINSVGSNNQIKVKVYNGNSAPETLIYSKLVSIGNFAEDAMNFIAFDEIVEPADTFFVGFELSNVNAQDTFVVYQSLRYDTNSANHFYFNQNGQWLSFKDANTSNYSMVNVIELLACNIDEITDTPVVDLPVNVLVYPNPTQSELTIESDDEILPESVSVYNMIGQKMNVLIVDAEPNRIHLSLAGNKAGVYFVRFGYEDSFVTRKISYVPH